MNKPAARIRLVARATADLPFEKDLQEIQSRLARHNYDISLRDAHAAWTAHSEAQECQPAPDYDISGMFEPAWEKLPEDDEALIAIILFYCKIW